MRKEEFYLFLAECADESIRNGENAVRKIIQNAGIVAGSETAIFRASATLAHENFTFSCRFGVIEDTWRRHQRAIELAKGWIVKT
ncbi:MAG: hypothetical protein AAB480_04850 [Patescibacteria group bacterium]